MTLSIIVAMAENRAIGKNGNLIWHNSRDLKQFKNITTGHTIVMGYKTYLSLPNQKALPNRRNIILSSHMETAPEGFELADSIAAVLEMVKDEDEVFIIGGGTVYEQFLPITNRIYLTRIGRSFEADTYFPFINLNEWDTTDLDVVDDDPQVDYPYRFEVLDRKDA